MEPRASYLIVGSFVIIVAVALIGFVLWLADAQIAQERRSYAIHFDGAVTGLVVGSPVRYRGVPYGQVKRIRLDPEDIETIEVIIETPAEPRIRSDAVARLESQGVTGASFIQILGGTQEAPPLTAEEGQELPVIPAEGSSLSELLARAPVLLERLIALTDKAMTVFDEDNLRSVDAIIANTAELTRQLAEGGETFNETVANVNALVRDLDGSVERLSTLLEDEIVVVTDEFAATMQSFRETSAALSGASNEIELLIEENRAPVRQFTQGGLYEFSILISDLQELANSLNSVSSRLERDASGFLLRGAANGVTID